MTPKDFYNRYKNLTASCTGPGGEPASVSGVATHRYIINLMEKKPVLDPETGQAVIDPATGKEKTQLVPAKGSAVPEVSQKIGEVQSAFSAYLQKVKQPGAGVPNASEALALSSTLPQGFILPARVQYGKGTPEDMETVLKAGLLCGKMIAYGPERPGQYVAAVFAASYFGIDCTGFANAYFFTNGKMSAGDVVKNWWDLSCPGLYNYARNHGNQIFWTPQEIAANRGDAVVVWMVQTKGGGCEETRKPGHISVVNEVTVDGDGATLDCYESNGGAPHDDPRNTTRVLSKVVDDSTGKYWLTSGNEKVLIIRPFL
jgi:hypothetical protein